ncbi:MAG: VPA1262 family protein [Paraburkholderia tropica]|uniref:Virulence plasmid A protein n=1 Tax=Paraburkholderia tropica TaxID=92647 RepID=A0ABX5MH13_9BURK|nr:VPA1262 family protein [Paraburkholderia tropica]MDE1141581.1 VPA1262 family protein [Paraburkholderia tropica]PXX06699.1 hypothetical protein C7400_13458 [Paraburkholderia tropica]PZW72266.1 hypothetical protein C7399_13458 [Paraburkholderia tropica]
MRKKNLNGLRAPGLDDLLYDGRLARLFSGGARHCALQLWILQIKTEQSVENRIVYGRLLPFSHSSDSWSASNDDNFRAFGRAQAQVIKLNLYVRSTSCAELMRQLSAGRTVAEISEDLELTLSEKLKARVGQTAFATEGLVYRPVAYLLNRDSYDYRSPLSPHGGGGALSASITQADKQGLFLLDQDYDVALTALVVKHLNAETGLDFGGADTARFGDLELLVFPALDDLERRLLSMSWTDTTYALVFRFDPMQVPHFTRFQFRLSVGNDRQIIYSRVTTAKRDVDGFFECEFELGEQLYSRKDSTELEIFGFDSDPSSEGELVCRWQIGYVREIHIQSHPVLHGASNVKFDWLEKTARPATSARVKAALTIKRDNLDLASHIGGRESDPWVPANRDLTSLFSRLHPPKSEGQFFQRWSQGDGDGRLQFVEWFRALLAKYQQHQVVILDPYFEAAGLGLILLCAAQKADYIVFRSLSKRPTARSEPSAEETDKPALIGIDSLLMNCEQNARLLNRIKLRIYGLKEGKLHDRYILVMGKDKLPIAGFNLSNSFQAAAQDQPLLITPIPADVLLKVEQYSSALVQEALTKQPESEAENPSIKLLFDSTALPMEPQRYEQLLFLDRARAGDVLSIWTGEPSLQGLSGIPLRKQMVELGLLKDDSLALPVAANLQNFLGQQVGSFDDFKETWEVLGEVLARSHTESRDFRELESVSDFLEYLVQFLEASFDRPHDEVNKELAVVDGRFFREPVEARLYSSDRPHHLFHGTKYSALTWAEYFAIKFLWWYAPDALLSVAERQVAFVPKEPQGQDVVRMSLLSQIVSNIALSVQFDIGEVQRERLVRSSNGLLQWMGLNAIEMQLEDPGELTNVLQCLTTFAYSERVRALGWMVHHAARNQGKAEIYKSLVAALHDALPTTIPADQLRCLVDSMRGHMRSVSWAEPWLFQDVVSPLLQNGRADTDDACDIWTLEIADLLEAGTKCPPLLFDRAREGQTTNIAAFLFAYSSPERQQASLKLMQAILKRQRRIVQQPLASTSNWTQWDGALAVSMWILAYTRWATYYLRERGMATQELEDLSQHSRDIAMIRPAGEWRTDGAGKQGELASFLDQVEDLLSSSSQSKGDLQ